jgi:hypothetical protein
MLSKIILFDTYDIKTMKDIKWRAVAERKRKVNKKDVEDVTLGKLLLKKR